MIEQDTLEALEFDRVREHAAKLAVSELGGERLIHLMPFSDIREAERMLAFTGEMTVLLREATGGVPIDGLADIREELHRARVGGNTLEPLELLKIAATMKVSRELKSFFKSRKHTAPQLADYTDGLMSFDDVEKRIFTAIELDGTIKDDASSELKQIRRSIRQEQKSLQDKLQKVLSKWEAAGVLQDSNISYRGGRLVLPVKDESRGRVQGVIVDSSASGATVFMEPLETLEISNHLRKLELDERKEINRILLALTALVHERVQELLAIVELLAELDEFYARGRLALRWDGVEPELNQEGRVKIIRGRHPLLLERLGHAKVIPLAMEIIPPVRTIVISGPNAGGKTVTLKTVGLFSVMAAAGLFVPAAPGTQLPFFYGIHADIGDSQSLESDLSTFTGHLGKLKKIIADEGKPKLILVDEIGSSTDPAVGAALAQSILLELTKQGAVSIVTTHNGTLKAFAHETDGMENGSMAFDEESLVPTYQYRTGVPGSSYALEIATRMGFPQSLIEKAQSYIGKGMLGLEELVGDLSKKIEQYEKLRRESDLKLNEYSSLKKLYDERVTELKKVKAEAKKQGAIEAELLMQRANREMDAAIKQIKAESASQHSIKQARERISQVQQEAQTVKKEAQKIIQDKEPDRIKLVNPKIGDMVDIEEMQGTGKIVGLQKSGKRVEVEINGVRIGVDAEKLLVPLATGKKEKPKKFEMRMDLQRTYVPPQLDLRGKYGDEAIPELDSYLAAAAELNYGEVNLIHGKGTGALRVKVREFLDGHPLVKGYHDGGRNLDDFGSTIVQLK